MEQLGQIIILGLLLGGVYALMASGLTLIFGVMHIINVAQGAFLVLAALITWELWKTTGIDPLVTMIVTAPLMFVGGYVVYKLLLERLRDSSPSMTVLLTFGLALVIEGGMGVVTRNVFRSVTPSYFNSSYNIGPFFLPKPQVYGCLAAVAVLGLLYFALTRTWMGRAIRASSQNLDAAQLVGVSATSVAALTFALGASTTGVGGSILSVLFAFFPASHYVWISRLLGIIVLGGMGSLPGAVVGALLLGIAETVTASYISLRWATVVFYLVIMVVLLVRPQGLFGTRLREDVT
ncbi:MAG TPA: branched-chain amino acid ABC transporter permease [Actinomycetota bacterium]|nr:branched-chain amino acid ABC transporter permease [Actinomycetota bacterium]